MTILRIESNKYPFLHLGEGQNHRNLIEMPFKNSSTCTVSYLASFYCLELSATRFGVGQYEL